MTMNGELEDRGIRILTGPDVESLLLGREQELLDVLSSAYRAHAENRTVLPHSLFLRFPGDTANRIIALPAYLGAPFDRAGVKWIASFPENLGLGLERASAVLILNSAATGRPEAILEGSIVSAVRTAASATLAARLLLREPLPTRVGMIGCGRINSEIARFLTFAFPGIEEIILHDAVPDRAGQMAARLGAAHPNLRIATASYAGEILQSCSLVSIATTAAVPHISDLSACPPRTVILHISLRDLAPQAILECINVVDDIDHVCRENTSIHLTELTVGHREFVACTVGDLLLGRIPTNNTDRTVVVSPFGLGILDVAVGSYVAGRADAQGRGTWIPDFFPAS